MKNRKTTLFATGCLVIALTLTVSLSVYAGQKKHVAASQVTHSAHASAALETTPTVSSSPTDTSTPAPTSPPPTPTPTPTPSYHPCSAQNCANPWGYVLGCSCGNMWQPVTIAPSGFCSWFHCAANFDAEQGDIGECGDGQFVHNGECGGHDGLLADLYVNVPPTPTA